METLVSQIQNAGTNKQVQEKQTTSDIYMSSKKTQTMCEYIRDHIMEEFEGAKDYMTKAIEYKENHPAWAKKFYKMAEMEIEHANCLNKIFVSMDETDDPCHDSMYKEILEAYTKYMTEISAMERMYNS